MPGRELVGYPEAEDKKARWGSGSASGLQSSMTESLRDWGLLSPPAPSPPPAVPSLAEGSRLAGYSSSESSPGERARLRETGGSWSAGGWNEKGESYSRAGEANAVTVAVDGDENGQQPAVGGNSKRFRPAPAKTFQCRGYGDCRMVFSRSEHLARHIRWVLCLLSSKYAR